MSSGAARERANERQAQPRTGAGNYLAREIRAYYDTPLEGDLALQAAFGAAVVYGPWHLSESTVQRGEIFDHPARSDREMQLKILYRTLRDQANTAVVAASRGDVTDEIRGYIAHHSGVALGDRDLILSQVDGLPVGLDGRDPRSDPQDA